MNISEITICEDDATIKSLLVRHGKQTHLQDHHGFTGPFRSHVTWADSENTYCVTHYHGYLLPSDNGYVALKIPLVGATKEELAQVVRMFIENGQDESGPYYSEIAEDCAEVN